MFDSTKYDCCTFNVRLAVKMSKHLKENFKSLIRLSPGLLLKITALKIFENLILVV